MIILNTTTSIENDILNNTTLSLSSLGFLSRYFYLKNTQPRKSDQFPYIAEYIKSEFKVSQSEFNQIIVELLKAGYVRHDYEISPKGEALIDGGKYYFFTV